MKKIILTLLVALSFFGVILTSTSQITNTFDFNRSITCDNEGDYEEDPTVIIIK